MFEATELLTSACSNSTVCNAMQCNYWQLYESLTQHFKTKLLDFLKSFSFTKIYVYVETTYFCTAVQCAWYYSLLIIKQSMWSVKYKNSTRIIKKSENTVESKISHQNHNIYNNYVKFRTNKFSSDLVSDIIEETESCIVWGTAVKFLFLKNSTWLLLSSITAEISNISYNRNHM